LLDKHQTVKNREEFNRSYKQIHLTMRRLFGLFLHVKDFEADEKKQAKDLRLTYQIITWCGYGINRPIRSATLGLGLAPLTRPDLNSNFFFPAKEEISVAVPLYANMSRVPEASIRHVRDDKRSSRTSAHTRKTRPKPTHYFGKDTPKL
jgi:hypothetical protein